MFYSIPATITKYHKLVAYKLKKFISHSFRGWEVQDQGVGRFSVYWEPGSWFIAGHFLTASSHGGRGKGDLWGLFYNGTKSHSWELCPQYIITVQRPHLFILSNGGLGFQHINFCMTQAFNLLQQDNRILLCNIKWSVLFS